jgi:MFS family permease
MKPRRIKNAAIRKAALSSFIGTSIEWFDFFIFNAATALLLFKDTFFANVDPTKGMLYLFGTYSVGFLARPVGGIVCGHFGDRFGRKKVLVTTLLITGIATLMIGLLPGHNLIGSWAPWALFALRFAQGFGIGGEWGGAVLMTVETAPAHRRGYYGSWPQVGVPVGLLLANLVFFGVIAKLPAGVLPFDWWRVPFLFSILLVGVGLYIRLSVSESPKFEEIKDSPSKLPLLDIWRLHRRNALLAMGAKLGENGVFYLYTVFLIYFSRHINLNPQTTLISISVAAVLIIVALPIYGILSDRFGRRRVYLFGAVFAGLFAFPSFWMVESGRPVLVIAAVVLALVLGWAAMYAPQASFFAELFETRVRYSGASLGAQAATIFAGGLMQIVAVDLLRRTNSYWPIALIIVGMSAITTVSVLLAGETFRKQLGGEGHNTDDSINRIAA